MLLGPSCRNEVLPYEDHVFFWSLKLTVRMLEIVILFWFKKTKTTINRPIKYILKTLVATNVHLQKVHTSLL